MLIKITKLEPYSDEHGNRIEVTGDYSNTHTNIWIRGKGNLLVIAPNSKLERMTGSFDGDGGVMKVGPHENAPAGAWHFRVGERSRIEIGRDVSCTTFCIVSAVEGTTVRIGDDCMIAANCDIRADDAHAIYDVRSGGRVNPSADVTLGQHVWVAFGATILSGVSVASGAVIGAKSVVTKSVPNNAVAAGNPAKVVRRNIAWERPHLSLAQPSFRPNASVIEKLGFWAMTIDEDNLDARTRLVRSLGGVRKALGRFRRLK